MSRPGGQWCTPAVAWAVRVVIVATIFAITALAVVPVAQAADAAGTAPGLRNLSGCLSATGRGDLLLLVDQSQSLRQSDPQKSRVQAAQNLIEDFARVPEVTLDVRVAGFASTYTPSGDWQTLTRASVPAVKQVVRQVASVDTGTETDYWTALDGARADLEQRSSAADKTDGCQVIVWISDGQYDLEARDTADEQTDLGTSKPYAKAPVTTEEGVGQALASGRASLCNNEGQGPVNALRARGVFLIGVGLSSDSGVPPDFTFMEALATATGGGGTTRCGTAAEPPIGAFLLADDVDALVFALDQIGNPGGDEAIEDGPLPPGATLSRPVVLDATVGRATILAGTNLDGVTVTLSAPDGQRAVLRPPATGMASAEQTRVGGLPVTYQWLTPRTVELSVARPENLDQWVGKWSLIFHAPADAPRGGLTRAALSVEGDLRPALLEPPTSVRADEGTAPLTFAIVRPEGGPIRPREIKGDARFSAVLQLPGGRTRALLTDATPEQVAGPLAFDLAGLPPGPARILMTLSVTTAAPAGGRGTELAPQRAAEDLTIEPPADFAVLPERVGFGRIEGVTATTATLPVTGPGCVWLDEASTDALPDDVSDVRITSRAQDAESCLQVEPGRTEDLVLTANPAVQGNGWVHGTLSLISKPLDSDRQVSQTVAFDAEMVKAPDQPRRWIVLVVALLLGLGIPPMFVLALRWSKARIPMGAGGLFSGAFDLRVDGSTVTFADGSPFELSSRRLQLESGGEPVRELALRAAPGVSLAARWLGNPFTAPDVVARADDQRVLTADTATGSGRQVVLPLAVHGHWIAWRSPAGADLARLVVLMPGAADAQHYDLLVRSVREKLPAALSAVPALEGAPVHAPTGGSPGWTPTAAAPTTSGGWQQPGSQAGGWQPGPVSPGDPSPGDPPRSRMPDDW